VSAFLEALDAYQPEPCDHANREWVFVPYDQLTDRVGPLAARPAKERGVVLVETTWKPSQRPYHKQKLAMVLASLRHFALEQARRGVAVVYLFGTDSYAELLEREIRRRGPLVMMEAAERELRVELQPLVDSGGIRVVPNETWATTEAQFQQAFAGKNAWRMDRFYREIRREMDVLMEEGKPVGGKFSFDSENRKRWRGDPVAPTAPVFPLDPIKSEVVSLVARAFSDHPGSLDPNALPATQDDAEALWKWARENCLPLFGPYEDAMSKQSSGLFHTRVSALMNNARLLPKRLVEEVEALDVPIASKEGFIRQVLGWREFMRHVHRETDGFRTLPPGRTRNVLAADAPLPPAYWGTRSGLHCLDQVVEEVWETGYGHHITRLMVLSNLATLLAIDPQELSDWFWVAYVDAYDWVVEPNVLGMGTFSLGDLFVTKPYVSGAAYIDRMSDYCSDCAFSPKRDCPITSLYWDFLARTEDVLSGNPRMAMPIRSLRKRDAARRARDHQVFEHVSQRLRDGIEITPEGLA
jgi:deoxyribodipyrimidine photolyase-related protein